MPTQIDFSKGFAIGDNIKIRSKFYRIMGNDNLRLPISFSAVSAGTTSSDTSVVNLNPKYREEMYQIIQIVPQYNVQIFLKQPASTLRWGTNTSPSTGFVSDRLATYDGGEVNNIFILDNEQPVVQIKNGTLNSITPRVMFIGWKYKIEELPSQPQIYTELQKGGFD